MLNKDREKESSKHKEVNYGQGTLKVGEWAVPEVEQELEVYFFFFMFAEVMGHC